MTIKNILMCRDEMRLGEDVGVVDGTRIWWGSIWWSTLVDFSKFCVYIARFIKGGDGQEGGWTHCMWCRSCVRPIWVQHQKKQFQLPKVNGETPDPCHYSPNPFALRSTDPKADQHLHFIAIALFFISKPNAHFSSPTIQIHTNPWKHRSTTIPCNISHIPFATNAEPTLPSNPDQPRIPAQKQNNVRYLPVPPQDQHNNKILQQYCIHTATTPILYLHPHWLIWRWSPREDCKTGPAPGFKYQDQNPTTLAQTARVVGMKLFSQLIPSEGVVFLTNNNNIQNPSSFSSKFDI